MMRLTRLKELRERASLTRAALALRSGVAEPTIVALETGAKARWVTVRKLALALGVEPGDLERRRSELNARAETLQRRRQAILEQIGALRKELARIDLDLAEVPRRRSELERQRPAEEAISRRGRLGRTGRGAVTG
jgi:DNA-binding XRE family transcriptional regulator